MSTVSSIMRANVAGSTDMNTDTTRTSQPLWLLAELTYRCPLHCAFCYNPTDFAHETAELDTDTWRDIISQADFWVLHEIDPQAIVARAGYMIDSTRQILFFHPDLMARLLRADPAALLEAPLKFAVMSLPQGGVSIRWLDPATAFARYSHPELDALGKELTAICETIAAKVVA